MREDEYRRSIDHYGGQIGELREKLVSMDELEQTNQQLVGQVEEAKKVEGKLNVMVEKNKASDAKYAELEVAKSEIETKYKDGQMREGEYKKAIDFYSEENTQLRTQVERMGEIE